MAQVADLVMNLTAHDRASDDLRRVANSADRVAAAQRRVGAGHSAFSRLGGALKALGVAAVASAGYFAVDSVKAYAQAEQQQLKLQDAYKKFPKLADVSIGAMRRLNAEMQARTRYDDDDLAAMQSRLAMFDLTGRQLKQLTPLVADYASASGKDIGTAGDMVGKALLGNTRALKSIGIAYTATGDRAKDYGAILDALEKKVGGRALSEASTAAVRLEIVKNQFGEVKEAVGEALLPALESLVGWMETGVPKLKQLVKDNMPEVKAAFREVGDVVGQAGRIIGRVWESYKSLPPGVQDTLKAAVAAGVALKGISKVPGVSTVGKGLFSAVRAMTVQAAVVNVNGAPGGGIGNKAPIAAVGAGALAVGATTAVVTAAYALALNKAAHSAEYAARGASHGLSSGGWSRGGDSPTSAMRDAQRGLEQAAIADRISAAQKRYASALDASGASVEGLSRKQQRSKTVMSASRSALREQASAATSLMGELRAANASTGELTEVQKTARAAFMQVADAMSVPRGEARKLAREYGLIPAAKQTKVSAPGARQSKGDVSRLDSAIKGLRDKTVTVKAQAFLPPIFNTWPFNGGTRQSLVEVITNPGGGGGGGGGGGTTGRSMVTGQLMMRAGGRDSLKAWEASWAARNPRRKGESAKDYAQRLRAARQAVFGRVDNRLGNVRQGVSAGYSSLVDSASLAGFDSTAYSGLLAQASTASTSTERAGLMAQAEAARPSGANLAGFLKDKVAKAKAFVKLVKQLQGKGIDSGTLSQVIALGPEGGAEVARGLLELSAADVKDLNRSQAGLRRQAGEFGQAAFTSQQAADRVANGVIDTWAGKTAGGQRIQIGANLYIDGRMIHESLVRLRRQRGPLGLG